MKTSCLPICFFEAIQSGRMSLSRWHTLAASIGLDGVEVYVPFLKSTEKEYLVGIRKELHSFNLEVSMLTGYGNMADTSPRVWQAAVDEVKRNVEIAAILGAPIVRVIAGQRKIGSTRDTQINYVCRALREAVLFASKYGVVLAMENHPEIGVKNEDFMEIIRRANLRELKVNLDTSNSLLSGDDPVALAKDVAGRVIHVHASDRSANLDHCPLGEGVVRFPAIFGLLKKAGFDGWISMEVGGARGEEGIRSSLDYLKRTWKAA